MNIEIPATKRLKEFLDELWRRGIIKSWEKIHGNEDEYKIKFNVLKTQIEE